MVTGTVEHLQISNRYVIFKTIRNAALSEKLPLTLNAAAVEKLYVSVNLTSCHPYGIWHTLE